MSLTVRTRVPAHRRRPSRAVVDEVLARTAVIMLWALLLGFYVIVEPTKMFQSATVHSIFASQQPLVFIALAALTTFVVGEFDLSVAGILGLAATLVPVLSVTHGLSVPLSCLIALAAGVTVGAFNGFIVVVLGVDGFIVTLGSASLLLGVALWASDSVPVAGLDPAFGNIALTEFLGLPLSFYYGVAIALAFAYILAFTAMGRHMVFVGANRDVARLAGVRVDRIRFMSYVVSASIASIGGILVAAALGGFDASSAGTYLLPALSAVFLGTAVVQPGRFNPLGTMVGVYFLATGILGLQLMGAGGWVVNVFYGLALVLAVSVASVVARRRKSS